MYDLYPRHEHHTAAADIDTSQPRGNGIFIHAFLQFLAWAVVFPLGMVLGLKKSKWHVPCQVAGLSLTGTGFILGEFLREEAGRRGAQADETSGALDRTPPRRPERVRCVGTSLSLSLPGRTSISSVGTDRASVPFEPLAGP